jgi:hypothetical protein
MEDQIAQFLLRAAKLEFFLANADVQLVHLRPAGQLNIVSGVNWTAVAQRIEAKYPFAAFDFALAPFGLFKETAPQYLVWSSENRFKWDSDDNPINSWDRLLSRSYAQLRNNIAHGNKLQMPAAFTHERTAAFLDAGNALIEFIASDVFARPHWETPIVFQ